VLIRKRPALGRQTTSRHPGPLSSLLARLSGFSLRRRRRVPPLTDGLRKCLGTRRINTFVHGPEYGKSLAADSQFTDALHGLSRALQDLNRLDEAIDVSKQISEIDPDDILAHTSLSILYQKKGMVPEAEAEGNKARVLGWKQQLKKGG